MSDTTSPTPEKPEGADAQPDAGAYAAPAAYSAPNPYVAQNPYVAPNPYAAGSYPASATEAAATPPTPAPATPAPNPYAASAAYQPAPTVPAPYAPAPYTVGGAAYAYAPRTNPLAITSMVLSLVGILTWITALGGIITGHIALSQIKRTGEGGRGMAIAGLVVGYVMTAFVVLYILLMVAVFGTMWASGSY